MLNLQDSFDEREQRERAENSEWREECSIGQDRQLENRRDIKEERNERPQRPDSRDSRASRESKASLRDEELHKLRDCNSWVSEMSDYEEKKRDLYHEEPRERDRDRDRRQPPGPVTKEKLEADELKNEKRCLTQLKRGSSDQDKKDQPKESSVDIKKDADVWNRKTDRNQESRPIERGDNSPKAWADAISPTFEKEEEKTETTNKDGKETNEIKQSLLDKPLSEKREETAIEDVKEQMKDEKREKNARNRTSSSSSNPRVRETRGGRWGGTYGIYTRGWRNPESRGRRGGPRSVSGKPGMSAKSGSYGHTDSENSADEVSGSTESGKEDKRSTRSPKPFQKIDKDDRNREVSKRDEKRNTEYSQTRSDKRMPYDGKPSHEAFAPSGEPSRRGRGGGFRIRGTTGSRMEGYGPPSSKNPFSSERCMDDKHQQQSSGRQNPIPTTEKDLQSSQVESTDDKIIAKQQALTAGITGRRNKSPSQQTQQSNKPEVNHMNQVVNMPLQKIQMRKDESRSKRTRSGSRRVCVIIVFQYSV